MAAMSSVNLVYQNQEPIDIYGHPEDPDLDRSIHSIFPTGILCTDLRLLPHVQKLKE